MLAASVGLSVSTSGCLRHVRSIVNRNEVEQLSLTITTLSADGDRESIQLAQDIGATLEAAGIDIEIDMQSREAFRRSILINHDFDIYVGRHPGDIRPDFLYETLHSKFADESGWQNPFGFTNLTFDTYLERQQRAGGEEREQAVNQTLEALALEQPFVPICVPHEFRLVRTDRFDGWKQGHLATRMGYLGLDPPTTEEAVLRAAHTDSRPSQNLNPLAVEFRNRGLVTGLLYDSLAVPRWSEGGTDAGDSDDEEPNGIDEDGDRTYSPWLGADWTWNENENEDGDERTENGSGIDTDLDPDADLEPTGTLTVTLREGCQFHDGHELTADDVAFTVDFLSDTTRDDNEFPAPSPRYRGHIDPIADVTKQGNELEFTCTASEPVAKRVLEIPILPAHIWGERTETASIPAITVADGTTEALITDNLPPIGSGPFQFENRTQREFVTLERFDEHFTRRESVALPEASAETLRIRIDPRSTSAIELVETDEADVTSLALESYVVDDVLEAESEREQISDSDPLEVIESSTGSFYHLGFNARTAPFSNPRFRRVIARLIDKEQLVSDVFYGHARPIAAPVTREWTPDSLAWTGTDPETPFLGTDGELDVEAARAAFEEAGFRYDDQGRLRVRY
ncbi:family 5 extracellular solute-binding protein [Natrialba asiatica DSM 12278]|uniref:Family 5 extracellular solute-binding protein n=2 Tax=Natrialba asiatica TaxID=64602 RepID=M0AR84_NATA1|nr:ABC transporter substrate-binding protein [Natrialba asiatica]ELZ00448.1 family 5 extracellular solute-binding protein [Natrialba asiatica DSM 12278]